MEPRLTERQREVLEFIQGFSEAHGVPPTVREIGGRFHVTPRAAFDHLRALERKGYLRRRSTTGRRGR
jgi:repressor LexA